jgi:hypothetical protein
LKERKIRGWGVGGRWWQAGERALHGKAVVVGVGESTVAE